MTGRVFKVLFLCTGNSARSILAEAILNHIGRGRFQAASAGSKNWDEFAAAAAPRFDFVFTVCDNAAGELCPVWPGQPMTAHWGIADPAAVQGSDDDKRRAFFLAFTQLNRRISLFVSLPFARLEGMALQRELDDIGRLRERGESVASER